MESLQNKCIKKLLAKNEFNPLTIMTLERMVNFNYLTDEILISLYYKFKDSNKNILNQIPERIKIMIDERDRIERLLDNMTLFGAAELDFSFDGDYDAEGYNSEDEREYERENMVEDESIEYLDDTHYNTYTVTFSLNDEASI